MNPRFSTLAPTTADDSDEHLIELAGQDVFAPLRWLDRVGDQVSLSLRSDQVREVLRSAPRPLVVRDEGDILGGLVWRPVPDLAEHFDVPVHEVVAVLVNPAADRKSVVAALLRALTNQLAGDAGFVMLRIEVDDIATMAGATATGFTPLETSLVFVNDLERRHLNPPFDAPGLKIHRFADGPLPDEMYAALRSAPVPIVDDHYHADPRLDNERCDALYERRRDQVLEGIRADVLVYREIDDVYSGFGTFKRDTTVEPYGITLLNDSIGYRLPGAPPGYNSAAAAFMCNEPLLDNARFVQWDTQVTNYPMVNMLAGRRSIRLCRASYMLHCWTDEL